MQIGVAPVIMKRVALQKLAIITSHPIQYYAPWFHHLASDEQFQIRVFYLWDFGVTEQLDAGFRQPIKWDVPLLSGYDFEFVPNASHQPGTQSFWGLQNPTLTARVAAFDPDAVLMIGYNYASLWHFIWDWRGRKAPLFFRGDSHRLVSRRGGKEWLRRQFLARLFRRFSAFLYVGKANRQYFRYHGISDDKLFFAPHAVDNDRFIQQHQTASEQAARWKRQLGIPESHAVILFAGKFEAKKRPLDLLRAFIQADLQEAALLFSGAGPLELEMRKQADGRGDIFFAPFQNQSLMPRTYAAADLFVLPSYGPGETWGLAVNEAMCMARPVIVSTHVGCTQDLIQHGNNGLIFPAGNVAALAECLQEALADRARLRNWGKRSQAFIQGYSYTQTTLGLKQALTGLNIMPRSDYVIDPLVSP